MSKKNKDIEVRIEEINIDPKESELLIHQLFIGKRSLGYVKQNADKKYTVEIANEQPLSVKTLEEGYEILVRHYNLFEQ